MCSLVYLDPTDPFFKQVGAALLNEVRCLLHLYYLYSSEYKSSIFIAI